MTREEKDLLHRDLCARLPYGVKVKVTQVPIGLSKDETLTYNSMYTFRESDEYITIKPYLRPMSSMTEEEKREFYDCVTFEHTDGFAIDECCGSNQMLEKFDWLNAHHFDYRGLIEKGLAIAVTEDNNPYND